MLENKTSIYFEQNVAVKTFFISYMNAVTNDIKLSFGWHSRPIFFKSFEILLTLKYEIF